MSSQIDFRTMPANVPVLCIPRVYANISESRIRKIFDDLNMGTLERIDIVGKNNGKGEKFNRVYVHFRRWNNSENACLARERLLNGKEIKIIYDDPWFWKISAYRETVHSRENERKTYNKPTLQVDYDEDRPRHFQSYDGKRDRNYDRRRPRYEDKRTPRREGETNEKRKPELEKYDNPDTSTEKPSAINYGNVVIPKKKKPIKLKIEEETKEEIKIEEETKEEGETTE
jgi:hypothetical protein